MLNDKIKNFNNLDEPEQQRIWFAIDSLAKDNPNVVNQLEALAKLRIEKPGIWKSGLKFLKIPG